MQTLYIDVYFFINFTVDILSLYFASSFSKVKTTVRRVIVSGVIGALAAVLIVFLPDIPWLKLLASGTSLILMGLICSGRVRAIRAAKLTFAFVIFQALLGGLVSFLWGILDKYLYEFLSGSEGGAVNRKMLFLSLIVLLSIGVFKMIVSFFTNNGAEGSVPLEIKFIDKSVEIEAFIDSGNLAKDPMDLRPVMLLKPDAARQIFPQDLVDLRDPDLLDKEVRKRIRLIPISTGGRTHVLTGVRVDGVIVKSGKAGEPISVTVAIDKEGGTYGGFDALIPSAALENALD